jgi:hypothetical protein
VVDQAVVMIHQNILVHHPWEDQEEPVLLDNPVVWEDQVDRVMVVQPIPVCHTKVDKAQCKVDQLAKGDRVVCIVDQLTSVDQVNLEFNFSSKILV